MLDLSDILEQLRSFDCTPLLLALLLGGVIGLEREVHGRPAGLRTHMMVCLCSAVLVSASKQIVTAVEAHAGASIVFDPSRLSAGIVTGIGFLGAAAVVRSGDMVRGLTTGASVWSVAGLGVVIGQGSYGAAVWMTAAALFVLIVLDWLPGRLGSVLYRRLKVRGESARLGDISRTVHALLRAEGIRVQEIGGELRSGVQDFELSFHVRSRAPMLAPKILERVAAIEGVTGADWTGPRR